MKIVKQALKIGMISILLYSVIIVLRHPHKDIFDSKETFLYSKGDASESVRSEILTQLHKFQDGYTHRDLSQLEPFMEELFLQDNTPCGMPTPKGM